MSLSGITEPPPAQTNECKWGCQPCGRHPRDALAPLRNQRTWAHPRARVEPSQHSACSGPRVGPAGVGRVVFNPASRPCQDRGHRLTCPPATPANSRAVKMHKGPFRSNQFPGIANGQPPHKAHRQGKWIFRFLPRTQVLTFDQSHAIDHLPCDLYADEGGPVAAIRGRSAIGQMDYRRFEIRNRARRQRRPGSITHRNQER